MKRVLYMTGLLAIVFGAGCLQRGGCGGDQETSKQTGTVNGMKAPAAFSSIDNETERSRAIFSEMGKVFQHPRCTNCHPTGDAPLQGERSLPHQPMVQRGRAGMGRPGMRCNTCHGSSNYRNVPGFPAWRMAPRQFGWAGQPLSAICETLKGPEGGRSLQPVVSFIQNSHIVAYGWSPPEQYQSVPGTHERFGQLAEAWVASGAHCPKQADDGE